MPNPIETSTALPAETGLAYKTAAADAVATDAAASPPELPIDFLIVAVFNFLSGVIAEDVAVMKASLQKKKDTTDACNQLLSKLSSWNTPPLVPKTPADPFDPVNKDRIQKTDELYRNGISVPDSVYDAVTYVYSDPPITGYSRLPIELGSRDKNPNDLVVGQVYNIPDSSSNPEYFVFLGKGPDKVDQFAPANSALPLKMQHGTDFSNLAPGTLVRDLDNNTYYRVSDDKTGMVVSGYPLQKFIQNPGSDESTVLDAQIYKKINTSIDLSKEDALKMQKLQGSLTNSVSQCSNMLATVSNAKLNISNRI